MRNNRAKAGATYGESTPMSTDCDIYSEKEAAAHYIFSLRSSSWLELWGRGGLRGWVGVGGWGGGGGGQCFGDIQGYATI